MLVNALRARMGMTPKQNSSGGKEKLGRTSKRGDKYIRCLLVAGVVATCQPRVSVSRSIFALVNDHDRAYFGGTREEKDQVGFIDDKTQAIFGRSYAAEPQIIIEQLRKDEAIAEADTLLLTVPNQLGVAYNAHVIGRIIAGRDLLHLQHLEPTRRHNAANQPVQWYTLPPLFRFLAAGYELDPVGRLRRLQARPDNPEIFVRVIDADIECAPTVIDMVFAARLAPGDQALG
jgi:hypothetical protein